MQPYHIGTLDFCFKNTRSYPIKVVSTVKNGIATVEIYGIKEEKEYEVEIQNNIVEVTPCDTTYINDSSLNEGVEQVKQYGSNGVESETYKILKYNGAVVSKELLSTDTYSPLEKIVLKGTKKIKQTSGDTEDGEIKIETESMGEINPDLLEQIKELE